MEKIDQKTPKKGRRLDVAPSPNSGRCLDVAPVPNVAFNSVQLSLFQQFLGGPNGEGLSNAVDLWDSVPRYSVTRAAMHTMRTADGHLEVYEIPFNYRGRALRAVIYPARLIKDGKRISFYPSSREELIEHALRKLAAQNQSGFFDGTSYRSGVRFSLWQLRQELAAQGHAMRFEEIVDGLDILALSAIEIQAEGDDGERAFALSTYLPALSGVRRKDLENDSNSRWAAQFHPLVTQSIDMLTYRQMNYRRLMKCSTQLARWLLLQLVIKYTQAAATNSFEMRFTTIQRDSALLNRYTRRFDAVTALDKAWDELKALGTISTIQRLEQRGPRRRLDDVIYTVTATPQFASEQRAANRRLLDAKGPDGPTQTPLFRYSSRPRAG
jgi:hypothetical protein